MRLYRGQGAERPIDPRSTVGRYFTNEYGLAECFADSQDGDVFYVDVAPGELPPAISVGRGVREYLVSRAVADRKQLCVEVPA